MKHTSKLSKDTKVRDTKSGSKQPMKKTPSSTVKKNIVIARQSLFSKRGLLVTGLLFGLVGVTLQLRSMAAVNYGVIEAESATRTGNVSIVSNSLASGGSAVEFSLPVVVPPVPTTPTTPTVPTPTPTTPASGSCSFTTPTSSSCLPFDMPTVSALRSSPKKSYAHYFPVYPISFDNKDPASDLYALDTFNRNGSYKCCGGGIRQRPIPRAPISSARWDLEDMKTEVRNAIAAGFDGFVIDILAWDGVWFYRPKLLMEAAYLVDPKFEVMLMPETGPTTPGMINNSTLFSDKIAELAKLPASAKLPDGRVILSSWQGEAASPAFWNDVTNQLRVRHGVNVALFPIFLDYGVGSNTFTAPAYGFSSWGSRNPKYTIGEMVNADNAHSKGKVWMQPISIQDNRPKSGTYYESNNTENLRLTWQTAVEKRAEYALIVNWNDYSEASEFAPSTHNGWSPLDINAYYMTKWKTGADPVIKRDVVYVSHRTQPHDALPSPLYPTIMRQREPGNSTSPRNTVELLSFMTADTPVEVLIGGVKYTYIAPKGLSIKTYPLGLGITTTTIYHTNGTVTQLKTKLPVVTTPVIQDLQYKFVSSLRDGVRIK